MNKIEQIDICLTLKVVLLFNMDSSINNEGLLNANIAQK
jgi:hypothetical protein